MSHSHGQVLINDKVVGYFEYDGTCDTACTTIQPTKEDVFNNWRGRGNNRPCECPHPKEENWVNVTLHSEYGSGSSWESKACMKCMVITGYKNQWEEREKEDERRSGGWW